jgi:hypothetical protein
MTPFEVISLGDISISLARGHYQFASTDSFVATSTTPDGRAAWRDSR